MMNHFNATVLDGNMVSTRRGYQVTKHKHNGIAFINASVQDGKPKLPRSKQTYTIPIIGEIKFVNSDAVNERKQAQTSKRTSGTKDTEKSKGRKPMRSSTLAKEEDHRSSWSTSSSSRASTPYSTDGTLAEESSNHRDGQTRGQSVSSKTLPAWASYKVPGNISDSSKRLLFMTLAFASDKSYPADESGHVYNPLNDPEEYIWLVQDPTSLHSAITLGAFFDAVKSGKQDSPDLTLLTSQLCFIINRRLNEKSQNAAVRDITIHAIASLAIIAGFQGKPDHWHVHMKGLLNLIALAGGQENLDHRTIATIRKADLVGAVSAGTKPCVPFIKHRQDVQCSLPRLQRDRNIHIVQRHMEACQLDPTVTAAIASVAGFNEHFDYSRPDNESNRYDPAVLVEHYYSLIYRLLSNPEPFRDFDDVISPCTSTKLSLHAQDFPTPESMTMAAGTYTKAIESAMRILVLFYLREPTFDLPCGERVLLDLLAQHARTILSDRQLEQMEDLFIDPLLLHGSRATEKPTLIWICVAGEFFSTRFAKSRDRIDDMDQTAIYKKLLMEVLGAEASKDPGLVSDDDLELCKYLDLAYIKNVRWNARNAIRQILGVIKTE